MTVVIIFIGLLMFIGAIAVLFQRDLKNAVITFGVISLSASIMFALMKAYDVAITEASIGSVLTAALFFWAIRRMEEDGLNEAEEGGDAGGKTEANAENIEKEESNG
jgi:energy-converting hydrogenase B subunit D